MGVQQETYLQQSIQKLIEKRGGYVKKNWGSMISEPGVSDLTVCYKGLYLSIEAKEIGNKPSRPQGIHLRKVIKSGGITIVAWDTDTVASVLDTIDLAIQYITPHIVSIKCVAERGGVDNGSKY